MKFLTFLSRDKAILLLLQEVPQNKYNKKFDLRYVKSAFFIFYSKKFIELLKQNQLKGNHEDLQSKFGEHLKRIREEKGLSLRSLASKCDLDDSQISKIENGKKNIQLSTIFELSKGLEIEPKDLLDFKI